MAAAAQSQMHQKFPLTHPLPSQICLNKQDSYAGRGLTTIVPPRDIVITDGDRLNPATQLVSLLELVQDPGFASKIVNLGLHLGSWERKETDGVYKPRIQSPEKDALERRPSDTWRLSGAREFKRYEKRFRGMDIENAVNEILIRASQLEHVSVHSGWLSKGSRRHALRTFALSKETLKSIDLSYDVQSSEGAVLHHHFFPQCSEDYKLMKHIRVLTLPLRAPNPILPTAPLGNLTTLILHHCDLLPTELRLFLKQTPRLEQLQFHAMYHVGAEYLPTEYVITDCHEYTARMSGVVDCGELDLALQEVRQTLRALIISAEVEDLLGADDVMGQPIIGQLESLGTFPKLQALSVPYLLLTGPERRRLSLITAISANEADTEASTIRGRLPSSLQHLRLTDDMAHRFRSDATWSERGVARGFPRNDEALWLTADLLRVVHGLVPSLTQARDTGADALDPSLDIQFCCCPREDTKEGNDPEEAIAALEAQCSSSGVNLNLELSRGNFERSEFETRFTGAHYSSPRFERAKTQRVARCMLHLNLGQCNHMRGHAGQVTSHDMWRLKDALWRKMTAKLPLPVQLLWLWSPMSWKAALAQRLCDLLDLLDPEVFWADFEGYVPREMRAEYQAY